MKLLGSPTSPFVRKVMVAAHEIGLASHIELVTVTTSPVALSGELQAVNPLAKIPALIVGDGTMLYDSRVIVEYLDARNGFILIPAEGETRWTALRRQALADGMAEALVLIRYEALFRPEPHRSQPYLDGHWSRVRHTLDTLEAEADALGPAVTIGEIAIGCALGMLDFRYPEEKWRAGRPGLEAFYARLAERPSLLATRPLEAI